MNAKFAEQAHADRVPVKVSVPLPVMNETLAHMEESGDESAAVAKWFLKNHRDVWAWVPADVAGRVQSAL